jgi:hypothetical protein
MSGRPTDMKPLAANPVDVRVCEQCGRAVPALHKDEYTPARAQVVATTGFCVCPPVGPDGEASIPERPPSLL